MILIKEKFYKCDVAVEHKCLQTASLSVLLVCMTGPAIGAVCAICSASSTQPGPADQDIHYTFNKRQRCHFVSSIHCQQ
jgi:hypothetical protein